MPKYSVSVPDASKPAMKISGVKLTNNPFLVLGSVLLDRTKAVGGMENFTVKESDIASCFPVGEKFWNITDMFCNSCNNNIHDYGSWNRETQEFEELKHKSNFPIFSKHKAGDSTWRILIYDPINPMLDDAINKLIVERETKVEFEVNI